MESVGQVGESREHIFIREGRVYGHTPQCMTLDSPGKSFK